MSSAAAGGLINAAVQQISADLGLDANTSGQLRSALVQAVTSVPQGSDSNSYAQAIAPAFARVLVSTNKLNARNAKQLGSNIATGLVKSVSVNAPRYGIRLPAINLDADLQKVNTVMVQFDASAPLSAGLGGVDASGSYPGGLDGSYPGGLDSTGGYAGGLDAGVDMQVGGAGSSGADLSSKLASTLGNALLQSDTFRGAFKRGMSSAAAGGLINAAVQQISADLGLDANTSGQLRSALVQAVTSVPQGSDSNSYAQAIAPAFARVLVSTNKLNARNAKQLGSNIATGLVKSVSVNAPRYGIRLPAINLDADLQKVNTVMVQFDASAPLSAGLGGVDASGSYPGGLDGSYPGGLDSTGGYAGGLDAGVDMQVGGAGSSGAGLSSKLASTLGNALLQSDTFRGAFKRGMSSAAAGGLINAAVQQISADLGLDANTSGQLRSALVQAVTSVPQGSDSNSYAQAIAPAFARVLVSTNKLNARNAKQLGSNIATGLVKSVSVNAPRYGIRLPAINLDADLQKVNTVMVQFDASAPLSAGLGGG
ncbi:hypothetical protein JTE90_006401 [Oedothorax gibbosus]|uniref:Tubuliform egg casing silk strands structural domain-containing protein n=1 Tax=Oedothorax gibbosus TaxID=931172 RepID=A0AAV6VYC4_9ARAC|nr:hypothetical protein JTE90_006401 [Oedothorax gibbosus]